MKNTDKKKILVIEDDPDARLLLSLSLEEAGYEVHQSDDGIEAYCRVFKLHPDLIITDVVMPKMSGNEFIKRLRGTEFGQDIPLIVLTGRHLMEDYFKDVQIDLFIDKPYRTEDMLKSVDELLRLYASKRKLEEQLQSVRSVLQESTVQLDEKGEIEQKVCEACEASMPATAIRCPSCGSMRIKLDARKIVSIVILSLLLVSGPVHSKEALKDGVHRTYYANGQVKTEQNYQNGARDGISKIFDKSGRMTMKIKFKKDRMISATAAEPVRNLGGMKFAGGFLFWGCLLLGGFAVFILFSKFAFRNRPL